MLITGANTGLGLESAKRLAAGGATLVLTARSQAKADGAVAAVLASSGADKSRVFGLPCDLADLASIKALPARLEAKLGPEPKLSVLLNNAGIMAVPSRLSTADGFERTVGVNHLGHFALLAALLPSLRRSPSFRVVTVSSAAHTFASKDNIRDSLDASLDPAEYSQWGSYGVSKACNVLFSLELQRRLDEAGLGGRASAVALHPGLVNTDLPRYVIGGVDAGDMRPVSEKAEEKPTGLGALVQGAVNTVVLPVDRGANTQVYLASGADSGGDLGARPAGIYFDKMESVKASGAATDPELARRLWDLSERLTGVKPQI